MQACSLLYANSRNMIGGSNYSILVFISGQPYTCSNPLMITYHDDLYEFEQIMSDVERLRTKRVKTL